MIKAAQLRYQYPNGPLLVFEDVDLPQGGVMLVQGPSGCGKSTWLALVAALVAPSAGHISVAGQLLGELTSAACDAWRARTIGFLPQRLHLSAALTVAQNLAMAQWAAGQPQEPERIAQALRVLGVEGLGNRKPAQLSGGQAQRVALARAVLLRPRVILADEPTASLDDVAAADAVGLLWQTARTQSATLVIATHDARVAALLANSVDGQSPFQTLHLQRAQP